MGLARIAVALAAAAAVLSACGGGGADNQTAQRQQRTEVLVIGNSLARHAPAESLGWSGDWGMAASAGGNDYAHKTAASMGLPVTVINAAVNEFDPAAPLPTVQVGPGTVVVLQVGDIGIPPKLADWLPQLNKGAALVCTSTYWRDPDKDRQLQAACVGAGGRWAFIGDIFTGRNGVFANEAVDKHPGDAQMAEIARRIVAAVGS